MGFETAEGAQPPLGFWDPLGLLKDADETRFNNLRFVEVKHGTPTSYLYKFAYQIIINRFYLFWI